MSSGTDQGLSPSRSSGARRKKYESTLKNERAIPGETLTSASFTALGAVAPLSNIPALSDAVSLLQGIAKLCFAVKKNRNEAQILSEDCLTYLTSIGEACDAGRIRDSLETHVETFTKFLRIIQQSMEEWSEFGFTKAFFNQFRVSDGINKYKEDLQKMRERIIFVGVIVRDEDTPNYEESSRENKRNAVLDMSRPENEDELKALAVDAKINGDANGVAELLGHVVKDIDVAHLRRNERKQLEHNLFVMSTAAEQLTYIPFDLLKFDEVIHGSKTYDIWSGTFNDQKVAIKKARASTYVQKSVQHILKEANNWRSASEKDQKEEYILKLMGVSFANKSFFMISRWMEKGDLQSYLSMQDEQGISVDRMQVILRLAKGLRILHGQEPPIAHGHLRASNIIVNDNGHPLLADFGLSKSLQEYDGHPMTVIQGADSDSTRWFAPEVLSDGALISTRSDVYSFAMTVLEIMTNEPPFSQIQYSHTVPSEVQKGLRPDRPTDLATRLRGLDDRLWNLLTRCWAQNPQDRLDILSVHTELENLLSSNTVFTRV